MGIQTAPGEQVIWQGQPRQGIRFAPQDLFAIPFAAFWLAIVLSIFAMGATDDLRDVPPAFWLVIPLFVVVGLYMLIGRFLVDRIARRKTHYYLTTERAIIEAGLFRPDFRSVSLGAVPEIRVQPRRNGRGTVQFGSAATPFGMLPPNWPGARQFLPPAFDDIDEAQRVYELALARQRELQRFSRGA